MGKGISKDEYQRAKHQLKPCRVATCPNAARADGTPLIRSPDRDATDATYCGACKTAKRTARDYERANR